MSARNTILAAAVLAAAVALVACPPGAASPADPTPVRRPSTVPAAAPPEPIGEPSMDVIPPSPIATAQPVAPRADDLHDVEVRYTVERRTDDAATAGFAAVVDATLSDPRGWRRAGLRFVRDDAAPYRIVLAEGPEVDALCHPYRTWGLYSCQNGPVVALNADRWRSATPKWTGDLEAYRVMLINHEVGHLLHLHHPAEPQCPRQGEPAAVMAQQSTELDGCLPNAWPLQWEVELAARRGEPLAPGPDHDADDHRPTPP
ncbi:MAG: DUF3152 domain-containing protein [Actinomycetota bacterium]|nr:DUF3152 domain-containing protein [Actinomycetota bacterium]